MVGTTRYVAQMVGFVLSVLGSIGAFLFGVMLMASARQDEKNPPDTKDASFWDVATGKTYRKQQRHAESTYQQRMWAGGCFAFAVVSAIGAVATWATMPGH